MLGVIRQSIESEPMSNSFKVVMIGGTGAVGTECLKQLLGMESVTHITLLGRREHDSLSHPKLSQHVVELGSEETYKTLISGHNVAICTLGVGEPSKASKEVFLRIDKQIPADFARHCKSSGIKHFSLLSSVGVDANSRSFFLRTKGELELELMALNFEKLSLFHPSMILTPTNRYGFSQALTLAVWPLLKPVLAGPLRKMRGVEVQRLGQAIALNLETQKSAKKVLEWDDFMALTP